MSHCKGVTVAYLELEHTGTNSSRETSFRYQTDQKTGKELNVKLHLPSQWGMSLLHPSA